MGSERPPSQEEQATDAVIAATGGALTRDEAAFYARTVIAALSFVHQRAGEGEWVDGKCPKHGYLVDGTCPGCETEGAGEPPAPDDLQEGLDQAVTMANDLGGEVERLEASREGHARLAVRAEKECDALRAALEAVVRNDQTPRFAYGEARESDGEEPPAGERWQTPTEIARAALDAARGESA